MNKLFDIPPIDKIKYKGTRCRDCESIYQHQYNKTKYCRLQKQKGTSYGNKKIKALDPSCFMFTKQIQE